MKTGEREEEVDEIAISFRDHLRCKYDPDMKDSFFGCLK